MIVELIEDLINKIDEMKCDLSQTDSVDEKVNVLGKFFALQEKSMLLILDILAPSDPKLKDQAERLTGKVIEFIELLNVEYNNAESQPIRVMNSAVKLYGNIMLYIMSKNRHPNPNLFPLVMPLKDIIFKSLLNSLKYTNESDFKSKMFSTGCLNGKREHAQIRDSKFLRAQKFNLIKRG